MELSYIGTAEGSHWLHTATEHLKWDWCNQGTENFNFHFKYLYISDSQSVVHDPFGG